MKERGRIVIFIISLLTFLFLMLSSKLVESDIISQQFPCSCNTSVGCYGRTDYCTFCSNDDGPSRRFLCPNYLLSEEDYIHLTEGFYDFSRSIYFGGLQIKSCGCNNSRCGDITPIEARDMCINSTTLAEKYFEQVNKSVGYDYELRTQYINCDYGCINYSVSGNAFGKCNPDPLRAAPQYVKNNSQIVFFQRINKYNFTPYNEYYTPYLSTDLYYEYYGLNTPQGIFVPFSNRNFRSCSHPFSITGFFFNLFDDGNYSDYKDFATNDSVYSGKTRINDTSLSRSVVVNEVVRSGPSLCKIEYPGSCFFNNEKCRDYLCGIDYFKFTSNITIFIDNKPPEITLSINNGANITNNNVLQLILNYNENYPYKCRFNLSNFSNVFYNNSGDADGDSFITWEDADLIKNNQSLNETQRRAADINNDGVVNATDMNIVVGIILNNYNQTYAVPQAGWQNCPSATITLNQSPGVVNVYAQMVDRSLNINTTNKTILFLPNPQFTLVSPSQGSWQKQNFNVTWNVTYANNCSYRLKVNGIYKNWTPIACNNSILISVGSSGDCNVEGNSISTCGVEINASYTQNGYTTSNTTYYYFGIDYTSPSNTIISPIQGGIYNSTNPLPYLNGTAFDNTSGIDPYSAPVRLYLYNNTHYYNGSAWVTNLTYFTAAYWSNTWSVSAPSFSISAYRLNVTVYDRAGNYNTSSVLFYYANSNMIPYINIISPQNNTWQRDPNVTLSIQDTSASSCWYSLSNNGGVSWQNYTRQCNANLVVTIGQSSMCNNEGEGKCVADLYANSSIGITTSKRMVFNIDYNYPLITNIYPANGSQIYGGIIEITGVAYTSANNTGYPLNASSIKVKLSNGSYCYNFNTDTWSSDCTTLFQVDYYDQGTGAFGISLAQGKTPEGKYNITINATDALNHTTIVFTNFSVMPGPSVSITSPAEFSWHNKTFNITMIDSNADNCSYQVNNGSGYGVKTSRPCNQNLPITVGPGNNCSQEGYAKCAVRLFAKNNSYTAEANITRNYSIDFNYPNATIITPQNNSRLPELTIINGTAYDTAYPLNIGNIMIQLKNNSNNKCFNFSSRTWGGCNWNSVDSFVSGVWRINASNIVFGDNDLVYTVILNVTDIVSQSTIISSNFKVISYPEIRVLSPDEHSWHNRDFIMNISDTNAVNCSYSVSNGGSQWSPVMSRNCSSQILITVGNNELNNCTNQGDDECRIKLIAFDEFGRNSTLTVSYSIDYTNPSATISNPMNSSIINSIPMFNGTLSDSYSGIRSVIATLSDSRIYYYNESSNLFGPFLSYIYPSFEVYKTSVDGPWIGGWSYSAEKVPFTEGAYLLSLTAVDNASNSNTTSSLFFIDLSPSTCGITSITEDSKYVYVKSLEEVYYSSRGSGGFSVNVSASESLSNVSQIIFPDIFDLVNHDGASYSINSMSGSAQHSYSFDRVIVPSARHTIFCENDVGLRASDSFMLYHDYIPPFVSVEGKLNPPTQIRFACIDYGDNPSGCDGKVWYLITQQLECPPYNESIYNISDIGSNINIYSESRVCYHVFDNVGNDAKGFVRVANKSTVIINPKENQQVCGDENGLLIEALIPEEADFIMFYDNNHNFINTTPKETGYISVYLPNNIAEANGGVNDSLHIIKVESYSGYATELLSEDSVNVIWDCVPPKVVIDRETLNNNDLISGIREVKTELLQNDTISTFFSIKKELKDEWQIGYGAVTNLSNGKIFTLAWDTRTMADGVYQYVKATAVDDMGLIGIDMVENITIDNTPPSITDFSPQQGAILWGNTTKISFNATDALSGINVSSARISFDGKNWVDMSCDIISGNNVNCQIEWVTQYLIDGYYLVTFSIKDIAGNEAQKQVLYKFVKKPLVMLINPLSNTIIRQNFTMEAISVPETGFVEFAYKKISEEFWNVIATDSNPADGWKYVYNLSPYLPDGYYDFRVTAYDVLGATIAADISINVTNDNEKPVVNVSSPTHPNQDEWYNSSQVIIEWHGIDNYSGIYGFSYVLDNNDSTIPDDVPEGELGAFDRHNTTNYLLNDGEYWFHIKAIDKAGNIGETKHLRIRIDLVNELPEIQILRPVGITLSKTPEIKIKTNKACECTFNQTWPNISVYYNKTLAFSTSDNKIHTAKLILPEGEQKFIYKCFDFRGQSATQEHTFIIDPEAKPDKLLIITDTENGVYYAGQRMEIEVNATKAISGKDYPLDGLEEDLAAIIDGGRVTTNSIGLGEGRYAMSFKAPLNTSIQHSVSAYARTIYSPIKYFNLRNQSLTIEYLATGSLATPPNIAYVQNQRYVVGIASDEPADINVNSNKVWLKADPLTANMFIFLTLPYANLNEKSLLLSLKEFLNQVRPSFGLGKREMQSLSTEVDYPNIKIEGSGSVGPGRYTLVVRNAGRTDDGKIILEVEII